MRGQKQCQGFLWLFFRSLPLEYNRKMQISRAHTVSTNFSQPQLGGEPWLPKLLCDSSAQRAAEQPENSTVLAENVCQKYFHKGWCIPLNDDRNKSPCLDRAQEVTFPGAEPVLTVQLPPNISLLHSTSLL